MSLRAACPEKLPRGPTDRRTPPRRVPVDPPRGPPPGPPAASPSLHTGQESDQVTTLLKHFCGSLLPPV